MQIDVTSVENIPAFCSSDEETEDDKVLLFLPIAPEVEDPEDSGPPPALTGRDSPVAKRPKYKSHDISLEGAPTGGKYKLFRLGMRVTDLEYTGSILDCFQSLILICNMFDPKISSQLLVKKVVVNEFLNEIVQIFQDFSFE